MKNDFLQFIGRLRRDAKKRPQQMTAVSAGRTRVFVAFDWGSDTFILEKGIWQNTENHAPVLIVRKTDLARGSSGRILTLTTGNHATAAIPLLTGKFWNFGQVAPAKRSTVLSERIVCANVANGILEISQRDVATGEIVEADDWLQSLGLPLDAIVMAERNDKTLEFYRQLGQEWRVKPLAWTRSEIDFALRTSQTHINTPLLYYHSAKGVHFLSYSEFHKLNALARTDFATFTQCLHELVSINEGESSSFLRMPKFRGHHEVELFGMRRGVALDRIIPDMERLMEGITLHLIQQGEAVAKFAAIDAAYKSLLERATLADSDSTDFVETLYMHLTGEIYYTHNDLGSPAFDDRRTPLPGATFQGGHPDWHPGADARTRVLLQNIGQQLSQDELIEYANVYEIRSEEDDGKVAGTGATREVVYKTNRRALCQGLIEKRLAQRKPGYGSYMLTRVQAFKELGVNFGEYKLLVLRSADGRRDTNYYIRSRCPGETLDDIPARIYNHSGEFGGAEAGEDPRVVLSLGGLLGDAAAQNLVLKKYLPDEGCRFGIGKEVFEFGYSIAYRREMPMRVAICSVRGSLGWPDLSHTEENMRAFFDFYLSAYADVLFSFWTRHRQTVGLDALVGQFFDSFEFKTRAMHWLYSASREMFDGFDPHLPPVYGFGKKWRFALWALDRQLHRIESLRELFCEKIANLSHSKKQEEEKGTGA
ncbi:MAG: hypothetical protein J5985_09860 [Kiritimatiellae bacterium]|nr:hypothetical protein [Kiritimatiellia bacterium]